ncbi:hypothetical protein F5880DRAFT_262264 [Lentinula raphanica]|nr:hypothetical protein F5880DRAFT_262264 [Lentinula raphanica]
MIYLISLRYGWWEPVGHLMYMIIYHLNICEIRRLASTLPTICQSPVRLHRMILWIVAKALFKLSLLIPEKCCISIVLFPVSIFIHFHYRRGSIFVWLQSYEVRDDNIPFSSFIHEILAQDWIEVRPEIVPPISRPFCLSLGGEPVLDYLSTVTANAATQSHRDTVPIAHRAPVNIQLMLRVEYSGDR